jgi:hypothetical protein
MTMEIRELKRHWYGLTDRLQNPERVRWMNIITVNPEMAALEAESKNPGWTAHEAFLLGDGPAGLTEWRVELWPN